MRYPLRHAVRVHPVGFEPTPPKRLGLKSNALDQLGHGYKWAEWNSSDDGGVRTHARRLVPKTSASGRSEELRPLGHIINVCDSDRVRTRIDLGQRIDPATLAGVDFKSTALTTRPHYRRVQSASKTDAGVEPATFRFPVRPDRGASRTTLSSNNSDGTRTRNPQIRSLIRYPLRHGVVCVWRSRGLNPGLSACKADALPLSYTPLP